MSKTYDEVDNKNTEILDNVLSSMDSYIIKTPLIKIPEFDRDTGHNVFFKLENVQSTGSFKSRGVINYIRSYLKDHPVPEQFITYGTGNHGGALAWAVQNIGFKSHVFLSKHASDFKKKLIREYGGQLTCCENRQKAEEMAFEAAKSLKGVLVPTADNTDIILGAATVLYESILQYQNNFSAAFLPIGGGSLASGSLIVKNLMKLETRLFAGEPAAANDVCISLREGKLFRFKEEPRTIADAAGSLGVSPNIYERLKLLDGVYEISEQEILYWTSYFTRTSDYNCEPTSALAIAAAYRWLKVQDSKKDVVILISGDNVKPNQNADNVNLDPESFYASFNF